MTWSTIKRPTDWGNRQNSPIFFDPTSEEYKVNIQGAVQLADLNGDLVNPSAGASSGGGGNNTWSNAQGDFTATITAGTKNVTIAGLPWTFDWRHVVLGTIQVKNADGTLNDPLNYTGLSVSGGVITLVGVDDFATGDEVLVTLFGPDKAYNEGTDANIVVVDNPDYAHYTSPEHLINVSAVGDAVTSRYVVPMEGYKHLAIHFKLFNSAAGDTITLTVFATLNADADDAADTDWVDVTVTVLGAATKSVNNGTLEEIHFVDTVVIPLKYMFKTVTASTAAADSNAADVYIKKA